MTVTVLAFARYADLLGTDQFEMTLPMGATLKDLLDLVRTRPGGDTLPSALVVAVNRRQAGLDAPIAAGDEIALLPPMAGG